MDCLHVCIGSKFESNAQLPFVHWVTQHCVHECWADPLLTNFGVAERLWHDDDSFCLILTQVVSQAEPIAKDVTQGVVRPGAQAIAKTADQYSDDATKEKVQVATQNLAEQVRPYCSHYRHLLHD